MSEQASLFLKQSCQDTWEDYRQSLSREDLPRWDHIVLTAGDEQQADSFRRQLRLRQEAGLLPKGTRFSVVPDPEGKRVGSGGATLAVLAHIAALESRKTFSGLRCLVIHSGGDSRRIPQYSALGKLFSPVPRELPNGRPSTLFDELLISMSSMAGRLRSGMLLLSGDALLLFNPLQVDAPNHGAAVISCKAPAAMGAHHGVFVIGSRGNVARFLHKQPPEVLRQAGAVNDRNNIDLDTGAVILCPDVLEQLFSLVAPEGVPQTEALDRFVSPRVRLSLYTDLLFPMAQEATREEYLAQPPEGELTQELFRARQALWDALKGIPMKLLRLAPARFFHFGTTREVLALMTAGVEKYRHLGWSGQVNSSLSCPTSGYNSILSHSAKAGRGCYLETSYVHDGARLGDRVIVSHLEIRRREIPSGLVLHGLKLRGGSFVVRVWGVEDDPKSADSFLNLPMEEFFRRSGLSPRDLWPKGHGTLWDAKLYPRCESIQQALDAALALYGLSRGSGDRSLWQQLERCSLADGFHEADPEAILAWNARMGQLVRMDRLLQLVESSGPASRAAEILQANALSPIQTEWLKSQKLPLSQRLRLEYALGRGLGEAAGNAHLQECFRLIRHATLEAWDQPEPPVPPRITLEHHTVRLPLRVNWGGGWSDTPPYCMEHGGTVLNAAIALEDRLPVEVTVERLDAPKILLESEDLDISGEFTSLAPLQATGDPYDPFALPKAALAACGILPRQGGDLATVLKQMGGGFRLRSRVHRVPQGSGLGTSSILAAACAKALCEFFGMEASPEALCGRVLCIEQLMGTGGGWQDQAGGLFPGVKFLTTAPGLRQEPRVQPLHLSEATRQQLQERFALIYTGQRRLARNLLRDVMGRYLANEPQALEVLEKIQQTAALMRFQLERGRVDDFARLLDHHWGLSRQLDPGCTNTLIDQILASVSDLIQGRMICGAGGGGFLQVILRRGVTGQQLQGRLREVFQDNPVGVWPCRLLWS